MGKKSDGLALFDNISVGVATNRDVWVYNSYKALLIKSLNTCSNYFNQMVSDVSDTNSLDVGKSLPNCIKWTIFLKNQALKAVSRPQRLVITS